MRKLMVCSILICLFAITNLLNVNVYASSNEKDVVKAKLVERKISKEKEIKIKNELDKHISETKSLASLNNNGNLDNIKKYDLDDTSEIYILPDLFLSKYNKNNGLIKLLANNSRVNVKVANEDGERGICSFIFNEKNEVELLGSVFNLRDDAFIPNYDTLATIISEKITDVKDIKFAHSFRYYTTFVIVETKENEYLIPYSTAPERIGLSNGNIYTSKEAISIMSSIFDEKAAINNGDLNSGTPTKNQNNYISILALITLVLASMTLVAFRIKKNAQKYNN